MCSIIIIICVLIIKVGPTDSIFLFSYFAHRQYTSILVLISNYVVVFVDYVKNY